MTKTPLKIAFMGTPDFAATALQGLLESGHEVVCAYSQPPRPKGRGHKLQKSPVHILAEQHSIPVFTPKTLRDIDAKSEFAAQKADIAIVAAYGLLLPEEVLNAPKYGCLNIHGSLLPRWRGASPIQRAIWEGDATSGITIMQMDKGLDTGDMIVKSEIALNGDTTASSLHDDLAGMGSKLVREVLDQLSNTGEIEAEKQDNTLATYAHLLKKSDGDINWTQSAIQIDRQIRALNPWPATRGIIQGKSFKITAAIIEDFPASSDKCGKILSKNGHISCGNNSVLKILKLQPEGKKAMDFASAINGGYIDAI